MLAARSTKPITRKSGARSRRADPLRRVSHSPEYDPPHSYLDPNPFSTRFFDIIGWPLNRCVRCYFRSGIRNTVQESIIRARLLRGEGGNLRDCCTLVPKHYETSGSGSGSAATLP